MAVRPRIEVEGIKELNRAVRQAVDRDLGKRMGQANKSIGKMVIDNLRPRPTPEAVGRGAGATVRPSASRREVLLRTGGVHRARGVPAKGKLSKKDKKKVARRQWGKTRIAGRPGRNSRPYILDTAMDQRDEIEAAWLKAVADAMSPAFYKTEP